MKKTMFAAAAALLFLASCSQKQQTPATLTGYLDSRLADATTFEDSLVAIDGSFIGGFTAFQAKSQLGDKVDINEVIRGMREAAGVDTANASYTYGLQMGLEVLNVYKELAKTENVSRAELISTVIASMRLDSLDQQQVMDLQPRFQEMFFKVQQRADARRDSLTMNSDEARQNRMLAEAVAATLQSDPAYSPVGNDGVYRKTITPGDTAALDLNSRVLVAYRIFTIDGNQTILESPARPMFAGRPANEVVAAVMPYLTLGTEAEFFVPYQLAYGASGNERLGVGPCQSVMVKVSVAPEKTAPAPAK